MYSRFAFVVLTIALVPCLAFGQSRDIETQLAKCAAINGDLERLECYDEVAKNLGLTATVSSVSIEGSGKWTVNTKSNPIDDTRTITLSLRADNGKSQWGQSVTLVIRCKSNTTESYIAWNDYLGSDAFVTWRIGGNKAKSSTWSLSTDSKATFYPDNDILFIRELLKADKLVAQVTPYNESPVTAIFDIRGLKEAIKPLQETCGWE